MSIFGVEEVVLFQPINGSIRKEDVREEDVDRVEIHKCYLPGDVVKARVLSLGDARQYYLSTSEEELGVVMGRFKDSSFDLLSQPTLLLPSSPTTISNSHTLSTPSSSMNEEENKDREEEIMTFERKVAKPQEEVEII